jgi:hypothetical protein
MINYGKDYVDLKDFASIKKEIFKEDKKVNKLLKELIKK